MQPFFKRRWAKRAFAVAVFLWAFFWPDEGPVWALFGIMGAWRALSIIRHRRAAHRRT